MLLAAAKVPLATVTAAPIQLNQAPPVFNQTAPQSWVAMHAGWLTHGFAGLFILMAVGLIFLLAIQTTKQEGLSGTIGGRVESAYRGRMGGEEQLQRLTGVVAVLFVVCATILSLTGI
ncbi:MAG: preprotein translocase subunit SecG [Candidatus Eremiobacteraeota bacterium]|nr:preprotein translocase subunit SecG [Candidatus Eremiobacteraeota bacterium]